MEKNEWFKFIEWIANSYVYTSTGCIHKVKMILEEMNDEKNYLMFIQV